MTRLAMCATLVGSVLLANPLHAQREIDFAHGANWLVGYVANAPQQLLGIGAFAIPSPTLRWGLYSDVKIGVDSPARGTLDRSSSPAEAEELGDRFFKEEAAWTSVNLAVVRAITSDLAFYLGAGASWRTLYVQYIDDTHTRGDFGQYWVIDEDASGTHPNILAGALFRASPRVAFQFGAEAAPAGATVGVHLRLR